MGKTGPKDKDKSKGLIGRMLLPTKWKPLQASGPVDKSMEGRLSYKEGGKGRWMAVNGRLVNGEIRLERVEDASLVLLRPLTFALITMEEKRRKLKLQFDDRELHHLWIPPSSGDFEVLSYRLFQSSCLIVCRR